MKCDQRQRDRYLGGTPPFGWRVDEGGELVAVPEQQRALKRMREMRAKGLALRVIADKMKDAGVSISHVGVKKALLAIVRLADDAGAEQGSFASGSVSRPSSTMVPGRWSAR